AIKEAEANLAALETQESALRSKLDKFQIENKAAESDVLKLEFTRDDLQQAKRIFDRVQDTLSQLQYEAKSPTARVNLEYPAKPSNRPNSDRRTATMATAPFATGVLVLGLLVLLEIRAGRVGDPDELASRVHL